jgi:hypothetical protein
MIRASFLTALTATLLTASPVMAENDTIEKVMKEFFKAPKGTPKVVEKIIEGQATDDEIKIFVARIRELPVAKPPRGAENSWQDKTAALLAAAELCLNKDASGPAKLKEAANCKACHNQHKPE